MTSMVAFFRLSNRSKNTIKVRLWLLIMRYNKTNSDWHHRSLEKIGFTSVENVTLGLSISCNISNFVKTSFH